jgi:SAM-dependent methyltransferase
MKTLNNTEEKWYNYLYYTDNVSVNIERVDSVSNITGREALAYTLRTLELLKSSLTNDTIEYHYVEETLKWSEVSKGGTVKDREEWIRRGYLLDIHNIASADIYTNDNKDLKEKEELNIVRTLIKTHGMIGQCLRGEVPVCDNRELLQLVPVLGKEKMQTILHSLNYCIVAAVDEELWMKIGGRVIERIDRILNNDFSELEAEERVKALLPSLRTVNDDLVTFFERELFPKYELWYFEAALSDFSGEQILTIMKTIAKCCEKEEVSYITFKPLADSLYYDYEGKKHINVYKKRIIEKYLRDSSTENVELIVSFVGRAAYVDIRFSKVCEKLIEFCVEAERSGLLTFEKSITVLYDMFGFRRDEFDRMNNEDKYLQTMNDTKESTKNSIVNYAVGDCIVDVGSGGGVLLDLLEQTFPEKIIIGTDISENVIEVLQRKKENEGHHWYVRKHNFVDGIFTDGTDNVDTIIFSSIIHEIFSYTETEDGRFNIISVEKALQNAYNSLSKGGRIVIRDGIKTPSEAEDIKVTFANESGIDFFENYVRDFKGLKDIEDKRIKVDKEKLVVSGCANYIREFLYTYTWGRESYAHEVQEQFGYFTLEEFCSFFEKMGANIIVAKEFLEPGYREHLSELVALDPPVFPNSNCIVVVEKR